MAEIKKQVEYYLSDKNLSQDEFFHNEISKTNDGYIPLALIMRCNKIKALKVSEAQIDAAIKDSTEVELNEKKDSNLRINLGIRRKNNLALPDFTGVSKKIKTNDGEAQPAMQ